MTPPTVSIRSEYVARRNKFQCTFDHPVAARWEADANVAGDCLLPNGTAVATQANGQVCILKLHHGQRRVSLAEAEAILAERGGLSAVSNQPSVP